jgi:hypothetical protein
VLVDYDVFVNVPQPSAQDPVQRTTVYSIAGVDFRLKRGSAVADHGVFIPNVTEGFTGAAPDLWAPDVGQQRPHYGPRCVPRWQ